MVRPIGVDSVCIGEGKDEPKRGRYVSDGGGQ